MLDANGKEIVVGQRVRFFAWDRDMWLDGTVRAVREHTYSDVSGTSKVWEARVDDGDPANPDLNTNGFHVAAHVVSDEIEVVEG